MTPTLATQLRISLGLSAYAVAKRLGCSRTHYVLWERGERQLSAAKLQTLTQLLKP
jgi:transcriptional regulator with XRE-family HTH domain